MTSIYHAGELAVQARAGVQEMAARIGRSIGSTIPQAAQDFLRRLPMAIVGSIEDGGRMWASVLTGEPGFMRALDERTARLNARPLPGDPLGENLKVNRQVGLLAIEPATRRRMRLNGEAEVMADGVIRIHARQVYANCPKHIQAREWEMKDVATVPARSARCGDFLDTEQQRRISEADTFFIASSHQNDIDASHRGGNPGFIRVVNERFLVWPDYSGNMMLQTLGNLAVNPRAGLLFIDFESGMTLQITGRAEVIWDAKRASEFAGAERVVQFCVDEVVEISNAISLRWRFISYSSFNPA
jgi:hypothetical protein